MSLFIDRIKEVMAEKNIIPADIVRETGISPGTISKYLSDEGKNHSFPIALKIANYLDVSAEWLGVLN